MADLKAKKKKKEIEKCQPNADEVLWTVTFFYRKSFVYLEAALK